MLGSHTYDISLNNNKQTKKERWRLTFSALVTLLFVKSKMEMYIVNIAVYDTMAYIAMTGLGVTVAEKFARRNTDNQ